jgi:hypothetical protein
VKPKTKKKAQPARARAKAAPAAVRIDVDGETIANGTVSAHGIVSATAANGAGAEAAAVWVAISALKPWAENPRDNSAAIADVAKSIERWGFGAPIIARKADGEVIAGHTRLEAAKVLGLARVPVRYLDLDPAEAHLLALADNKLGEVADWKDVDLAAILNRYTLEDAALAGFDSKALEELASGLLGGEGGGGGAGANGSLAERFGVPPFTVLNARGGWWQDRKRAWLALGIQSELGRGEAAAAGGPDGSGTRSGKANAVPGGAPMPLDRAKAKAKGKGKGAHSMPVAGGRGVAMANALAGRGGG